MLTQDTKKHIDAARQILVGVVPNPMSQVEQITNALIYKFMDDMDQQAIKAGGDPSFFVKDLEKYAWTKVMDSRLGNQERMNLYTEALMKFSEAKQLPQLFRDIFKQAFLPYRDPEVLGLFLKEISYFDYTHSEELGNAYEYLLSIMSSQGDAGQFRTPRHIIDFIVDVLAPTKDDTILDPACGTAGFLISAYNYIKRQNEGVDPETDKMRQLTADERRKLVNNFEGYDVDPTMVRLAQVNMYLHKFTTPKIYNYNTLASEERWNDKFDIILANPPFMSPKGGIKPHNKFSVQASRAEVLFVDYIMNHLKPKGRAGIIVPEGIIFQSGKAYKELRKNLVNDGLFAVVSLPAGVFNPYSGVKTSILFFDNEVAKKTKDLLFVKVTSDGYDLGAQRRKIEKDDLPDAIGILEDFREQVNAGKDAETIRSFVEKSDKALLVSKEEIAETDDYNLSADRYKVVSDFSNLKYETVKLGDVCEIKKGSAITKKDTIQGDIPVIAGGQQPAYYHNVANREGGVITVSASGAYAGFVNFFEIPIFASDCSTLQLKDSNLIDLKYIYYVLRGRQNEIYRLQKGGGQPHVYPKDLAEIQIPLPPLEVQKEIVEQIEIKQKAIEGAKQVIENLERERRYFGQSLRKLEGVNRIKLGEIGKVSMCKRIFKEETSPVGDIPFYKIGTFGKEADAFISQELYDEYRRKYSFPKNGSVLLSTSGTIGRIVIYDGKPAYFQDSNIVWIDNNEEKVLNKFLYYVYLATEWITTKGGTIERLYNKLIEETEITFPDISTQKKLISEMEYQDTITETNKKLIEIMEKKIEEVLSEI